jgi:hypothetical protein
LSNRRALNVEILIKKASNGYLLRKIELSASQIQMKKFNQENQLKSFLIA